MWNPFSVKCSTERESEYKKISWAIKLQIGFLWSNLDNKYVIWLTDRIAFLWLLLVFLWLLLVFLWLLLVLLLFVHIKRNAILTAH